MKPFLLLCCLIGAAMPGRCQEAATRRTPPSIILKLDDLKAVGGGRVSSQWQRVADFLKERRIKAAIGIIANSLEADAPIYFEWIKEQRATGLIEFWNHGYNHREWTEGERKLQEFKGPSLEEQKRHLSLANRLARDKLGFAFESFGAPFNATDDNTALALQDEADIKVWLYGDAKNPAGKLVLDRVGSVNIESPTFVPNLEKFKAGYAKYPNRDYFVIQGHPQNWNEERWAQFVAIIDFLTAEKAIFTTPADFAREKALMAAAK